MCAAMKIDSVQPKVKWPDDKDFAFTIFDDTDLSTTENVSGVYSLLAEFGIRSTKSVWPISGKRPAKIGGATCADRDYLQWVLHLKNLGFEVALHNASYSTSSREETIEGLSRFRELFGHDPCSFANHVQCDENIYWGKYRLSGLNATCYNLLQRGRHEGRGHIEGDPLFWGDLCKSRIKYVRNFVFSDINTLAACPFMPYFDPARPFVNYWFASSAGPTLESFNACVTEKNQDFLEKQGGACIMYTHFAKGFCHEGKVDTKFAELMRRLSGKNGWFVPVCELLNYLLSLNGGHVINDKERSQLEHRWILDKVKRGVAQRARGLLNVRTYI